VDFILYNEDLAEGILVKLNLTYSIQSKQKNSL